MQKKIKIVPVKRSLKPYYEEDGIVIYHGDSMKIMPSLEYKGFDLVLTDIPYGVVNRKDNGLRNLDKKDADTCTYSESDIAKQLSTICKGSVYIFCGTEQVSQLRESLVEEKMTTRLIIWEKTNPSPMNGQYIWLSGVECCVFGKHKGAVFNEHCKNSVIKFSCGRGKKHPTEKPLKMFEYLTQVSSNESDLILDPFMGSGTTLVAAKKLGRKAIGIELSKEYCDIAIQRLNEIK